MAVMAPMPVAVMPPVPTVMMPSVPVVVTMPAPAHFGGELFRIPLHRGGGPRIDQRHRLRALKRSGKNEKRADGREAENFRSAHQHSPCVIHVSAVGCHFVANCLAATPTELERMT
jgi:hypothetical protein